MGLSTRQFQKVSNCFLLDQDHGIVIITYRFALIHSFAKTCLFIHSRKYVLHAVFYKRDFL